MMKIHVKSMMMFLSTIIARCASVSSGSGNNSSNIATHGEPCNQKTNLRNTLLAIFCVTVLFIGVIGNSLSIIVILASRHLRSQIAYLFITSLAVADLGVSFFVTTMKIDMYKKNGSFCYGIGACVFIAITDSLFPMASITHLLIIGIDRWYAITYPFSYISNMTNRKAKYIICFVWFYSIFWTCMGMFHWEKPSKMSYEVVKVGVGVYCNSLNKYYHTIVNSLIYILPMSITTCLYATVLRIAVKQVEAISRTKTDKKRGKALAGEIKAAKIVSVVFAAYIVCWLPHIVIVMLQYWNIELLNKLYRNHVTVYDVLTTVISNILPVINSCVNPFIYFIAGDQFRVAFTDLMRKFLNKPRNSLLYADNMNSSQNGTCRKKTIIDEIIGTPMLSKRTQDSFL